MSNLYNKLSWINDKFYSNAYNYLYSMSLYHLVIISYVLLGLSYDYKVFFTLDFNAYNISHVNDGILQYGVANIVFTIFIVLLDYIFLLIVMYEFKKLNLTYGKINVLEVIIFMVCIVNPVLRMIMLFLSLNSIQITIFYKLIKHIPFANYIFLTTSYIILIKLLLYPIVDLMKMYIFIH